MSSIFLDALAVDVERAQRINRTLSLLDEKALAVLRARGIRVVMISGDNRGAALAMACAVLKASSVPSVGASAGSRWRRST